MVLLCALLASYAVVSSAVQAPEKIVVTGLGIMSPIGTELQPLGTTMSIPC